MPRRSGSRRRPLASGRDSFDPPPRFTDFLFINAREFSLEQTSDHVHQVVSDLVEDSEQSFDVDALPRLVVYDIQAGTIQRDLKSFGNRLVTTGVPTFSFDGAVAVMHSLTSNKLIDFYLDKIALFDRKYPNKFDLALDFRDWTIRANVGTISKREDLDKDIKKAFAATQQEIASGKQPQDIKKAIDDLLALERGFGDDILLSRSMAGKARLG